MNEYLKLATTCNRNIGLSVKQRNEMRSDNQKQAQRRVELLRSEIESAKQDGESREFILHLEDKLELALCASNPFDLDGNHYEGPKTFRQAMAIKRVRGEKAQDLKAMMEKAGFGVAAQRL